MEFRVVDEKNTGYRVGSHCDPVQAIAYAARKLGRSPEGLQAQWEKPDGTTGHATWPKSRKLAYKSK